MTRTATAKAYKGLGMEGAIAKWYAKTTAKSMDEFSRLAREMSGELRPRGRVLEVAPGPGYFAIEMAKLGHKVTAIDISRTFVEIGRNNAAKAGVEVAFREGDAAHLPFEEGSFDFVMCRAAFKNFADPVGAMEEMYRVLTKGGRAVIIDLRRDASPESVRETVDQLKLGSVNALITKLTFRFMLLPRAYTRADIEGFVSRIGAVEVTESGAGMEIVMRKTAG